MEEFKSRSIQKDEEIIHNELSLERGRRSNKKAQDDSKVEKDEAEKLKQMNDRLRKK